MDFTSFMLLTGNNTGYSNNSDNESSLLSSNNSQETSLLSAAMDSESCTDAFAGKDIFGTCDISTLETIFANSPDMGAMDSVAFDSSEAAGSIAFNSSEAAGSVACGSDSGSCGGFSSFC